MGGHLIGSSAIGYAFLHAAVWGRVGQVMRQEEKSHADRSAFMDRWAIPMLVGILILFLLGNTMVAPQGYTASIVIYAFSTQDEVLTQQLLPEFEASWEKQSRMDVRFETLFGASGTLASQINMGAPADIAILSHEEYINWLRIGRKVDRDTQASLINMTPMVIVVRPGNPFAIEGFLDLAQPGLHLLHPDPASSGAGVWGVLAVYGNSLFGGASPAESADHLAAVWDNVVNMAPSARASMLLFERGVGDAMITYEQDARMAQARGVPLDIVLPARTLVAHHVFTTIDANLSRRERDVAEALLDFMLSDAGQNIFRQYELRGIQSDKDRLPALKAPCTIQDLGGWSNAYQEIMQAIWVERILPGREESSPNASQGWPSD